MSSARARLLRLFVPLTLILSVSAPSADRTPEVAGDLAFSSLDGSIEDLDGAADGVWTVPHSMVLEGRLSCGEDEETGPCDMRIAVRGDLAILPGAGIGARGSLSIEAAGDLLVRQGAFAVANRGEVLLSARGRVEIDGLVSAIGAGGKPARVAIGSLGGPGEGVRVGTSGTVLATGGDGLGGQVNIAGCGIDVFGFVAAIGDGPGASVVMDSCQDLSIDGRDLARGTGPRRGRVEAQGGERAEITVVAQDSVLLDGAELRASGGADDRISVASELGGMSWRYGRGSVSAASDAPDAFRLRACEGVNLTGSDLVPSDRIEVIDSCGGEPERNQRPDPGGGPVALPAEFSGSAPADLLGEEPEPLSAPPACTPNLAVDNMVISVFAEFVACNMVTSENTQIIPRGRVTYRAGQKIVLFNGFSVEGSAGFTAIIDPSLNQPPVITSNGGGDAAMVSVPENTTAVTDVDATDAEGDTEGGGGLVYSLSGDDAAKFTIDAFGILAFVMAPDFENPTDLNGDNKYEVTATVTDSATLTDSQDITVEVTDDTPPTATDDMYDTLGNTGLRVDNSGDSQPVTPAQVLAAGSVLDDDVDPDGPPPPLFVSAVEGIPGNVGNPTVLGSGATVNMAADGTFTYSPPPGFAGPTDTFNYTVSDNEGGDVGTVTINISDLIWFVDNSVAGPGTGTSTDPFKVLKDAEAASGAGDTIFVFEGNGTDSSQNQGIMLKAGQELLGELVGLTVAPFGTIVAAGNAPLISDGLAAPLAPVISLADTVVIRGLDLDAVNGDGIDGTNIAGPIQVELVQLDLVAAAPIAVDITNGTGSWLFTNVDITSTTGIGIPIRITGGSPDFDFNDGSITQGIGNTTLDVNGVSGSITFDAASTINTTNGDGLQFADADGTYDFNGTTTLNGGDAGIDILGNSDGTFTFAGTTSITSPSGDAFNVTGDGANNPLVIYSGTITNNAGNVIQVNNTAAGANTITFQTGAIVDSGTGVFLNNVAQDVDFTGTATLTGSEGIDIDGGSGTFTFADTDITNPTGTALDIDGGTAQVDFGAASTFGQSGTQTVVNVGNGHNSGGIDFDGSINATDGDGLQFDNADGTYGFDGTTTLNGGDAGIDILGNSDGTFTFAGTTSITNPTGDAFNVTGDGTNNPSVTYAGAITNNAGDLIEINNTAAGANTITFDSAAADALQDSGAGTGIFLSSVGQNANLTADAELTGSEGIDIDGGSGTFTFADTDIVPGAAAAGIDVNGGSSIVNFGASSSVGQSQNASALSVTNGHTGAITADGTLDATNGDGLQFNNADGSSYDFNGNVTLNGGDAGIDILAGSAGTFTFDGTTAITNGTGRAVNVDSSPGSVTFANLDINQSVGDGLRANASGSVAVNGGGVDNASNGILVINTSLSVIGVTLGATASIVNDGISITNSDATARTMTLQNNTATVGMPPIGARGIDINSSGTGILTANVSGNNLRTASFPLRINEGSGSPAANTVRLNLGSNTWENGGGGEAVKVTGQNINANNSTIVVTALSTAGTGQTVTANGTGGGMLFDKVGFDSNLGLAGNQQVVGGTTNIGQGAMAAQRVQGDGLSFLDPTGDVNFSTLSIFNNAGTGLEVNTKGAATNFNLAAGSGTINTSGGPAMFLDPLTTAMTLTSVTASGGTNGIEIDEVSGTFQVTGTTDISNTTADGILISDSPATMTFTGATTIGTPGTAGIDIQGSNGDVTFADVDITGVGASVTGLDLSNVGNTKVAFNTLDVTGTVGTPPAGSVGIDLTGTTNTKDVTTTNPSDIQGVDVGVDLTNANNTALVQFGDGNDTPLDSSIDTENGGFAIVIAGMNGTNGTYDFEDVDFGNSAISNLSVDAYFVDAVGTGTGTSASPGNLAGAEASGAQFIVLLDQAGAGQDVIDANSAAQGMTGSFDLADGQSLLSFAAQDSFAVSGGAPANLLVTGIPAATIDNPNPTSGAPLLTTTAAATDTVTVASSAAATIDGVEIGNGGAGDGISGADVTSLTVQNSGVAGAASGIDIDTTAGATTLDFDTLTLQSATGSAALDVNGSAGGTTTIANFDTLTVTGGAGTGSGISVTSATFDSGGGSAAPGGNGVIGTVAARVNGAGLALDGVSGTLTFDDLEVANSGGTGLSIQNSKANTFTLNVDAGNAASADVNTIGGTGIDLDPVTVNAFFNNVTVDANGAGGSQGIVLDDVEGAVTVDGTIDIRETASAAIDIKNNNGQTVPLVATFSGATTVDNATVSTVGGGVSMASNAGAIVNFTGGLDIDTTSGAAFTATLGGTVNVDSTAVSTTIDTTTGTAVDIDTTTIGGIGVTFDTVNKNGGANGILLNSAATGSFTVSGGTIQGTANRSLDVNGGSGNVTIGASLSNSMGRTVEVTGYMGTEVAITGAVDENSAGIGLDSNGAGIVSFSGGIDIDVSGSNTGFSATTSGTVEVCADTNCEAGGGTGVVNTIDVVDGTTVNLSGVAIGAGDINWNTINKTGTGGSTAGISVINTTNAGTFNGGAVDINGTGGTADGISIVSSSAAFNFTSATIDATADAGINLLGANGTVTFSTVDIDGTTGAGIDVGTNTNAVNINGGSIGSSNDPAGNAVDVNAGSGNVTVAATISNSTARAVEVTGRTGGTALFSGSIDEDGTGINLSGNGAGTVTFSGGMTLDTGGSTAFNASTSGTVNVCADTNCGAGGGTPVVNTVGATTAVSGTAVDIDSVTIGGAGVTFQSIDVDGGGTSTNPAINLDTTGAGTFSVTGIDGPCGNTAMTLDCDGGTIENIDGDAVTLDTTGGRVTFENMLFEDIGTTAGVIDDRSQDDAIHGEAVGGGLTLDNTIIRRISDQAVNGALFTNGVSATTWTGLTVVDSLLEDTNRFHVAGLADNQDEGAIRIVGIDGTASVTGSLFRRGAALLELFSASSGSLAVTVTDSDFTDAYKEFTSGTIASLGRFCISVSSEGSTTTTVTIGDQTDTTAGHVDGDDGNEFINCKFASVLIAHQASASGDLDAIVANNTFRVTDHSSTLSTFGNFPQGGLALRMRGGTLDGIVEYNQFGVAVGPDDRMGSTTDEIMTAAGGDGALSLIFENDVGGGGGSVNGDAQVRVNDNVFNGPINSPYLLRGDRNASAAVLITGNSHRGRDDFFSPDPFFGTFTVPGIPTRNRVRNGGNLDLSIENETMVFHDQAFFSTTETVEFESSNVGGGGTICVALDTAVSPDGFEFEEEAGVGSIVLYQGTVNNAASGPCTGGSTGDCEAELADDGVRGGPNTRDAGTGTPSATLNPPFVDVDGGSIPITGTACAKPSGGIF